MSRTAVCEYENKLTVSNDSLVNEGMLRIVELISNVELNKESIRTGTIESRN